MKTVHEGADEGSGVGGGDGGTVGIATPTLIANDAGDPDGDDVRFVFRVVDADTGLIVSQSLPIASDANGAVVFVVVLVDPPGVMKKRKQLDHMPVRAGVAGQHQPVGPHPGPVGDAVVAPPVNSQLAAQML